MDFIETNKQKNVPSRALKGIIRRMGKRIGLILFLLGLVLPFQACQKSVDFHSSASTVSKSESNGDVYTGKPTPYELLDAVQPCPIVGANGKPLPNEQIFIFPSGHGQLVREQCQDIKPKLLTPEDFNVSGKSELVYQGRSFHASFNQSSFDVVAATCPTGRAPLTNAVRTSLLKEPLNLLDPVWSPNELTVNLDGSLAGLPLYKIERLNPNAMEDWRRLYQYPSLVAGEDYVFSFFAKADPVKVRFTSYSKHDPALTHLVNAGFDLSTGDTITQSDDQMVIRSISSKPMSGGYFISVYFQSLVTSSSGMGLGPYETNLGGYFSATALQLEKISDFCAP